MLLHLTLAWWHLEYWRFMKLSGEDRMIRAWSGPSPSYGLVWFREISRLSDRTSLPGDLVHTVGHTVGRLQRTNKFCQSDLIFDIWYFSLASNVSGLHCLERTLDPGEVLSLMYKWRSNWMLCKKLQKCSKLMNNTLSVEASNGWEST